MTSALCSSCGKQLAHSAAFCSACGTAVSTDETQRLQNMVTRRSRLLPWQALGAAVIVIAIAAVAYFHHNEVEQKDAAILQARSSYDHLSSKLNALKATQLAI